MHKIMQRLSEVLEEAKGAIVLTSYTKAPHFHILAQKEEADNLKLEIWPGTVKIHSINEYQARWMQNNGHERIVIKTGLGGAAQMEQKKIVLTVEEGTQGFTKEFHNMQELKKAVMEMRREEEEKGRKPGVKNFVQEILKIAEENGLSVYELEEAVNIARDIARFSTVNTGKIENYEYPPQYNY